MFESSKKGISTPLGTIILIIVAAIAGWVVVWQAFAMMK